ncbi:TetR/AcrR family transcriptional regulator C-terminal domain-containing protein [Eubacteriaceae bacterium ES3]|nr:TetR/AcrR family transcriptional regulator C-terminal domain-containing protein [Eubacteriaceae bacterium ES3]
MDINDRTKEKLAKSIKDLMANKPLDKITVKEIVDHSELTRQTFYRYFQDKYHLVNWYFDKLAQQSIRQMGVSLTLEEGLTQKFTFVKNEKTFFTAAFKSSDCNSIYDYDLKLITDFYIDLIMRKTGQPVKDDNLFLLDMYCRGSMAMTYKWVLDGMTMDPNEFAKLLIAGIPEKLKPYLLRL